MPNQTEDQKSSFKGGCGVSVLNEDLTRGEAMWSVEVTVGLSSEGERKRMCSKRETILFPLPRESHEICM